MPRDAVGDALATLLVALQHLPARGDLVGAAHLHVAEDVRVSSGQLVAHAVGDGGQVEQLLLVTEFGVKDDLEQQVAELLFDVRRLVGSIGVVDAHEGLQRVERLVRLFEQMARQRGVRLFLVPRTLRAQSSHEGDQVVHRLAGRAQSVDPE